MRYFNIPWCRGGGHTLASYATGGRFQGPGRGRLHGLHTQSALLCDEWRRTVQSLPQWRFLFSVPLCMHPKQKTMDAEVLAEKSSCRVPAEQGALQDWTKHRLAVGEVHALWPGCRTLNKERRLLSQDADALLRLDANNYCGDGYFGCWC